MSDYQKGYSAGLRKAAKDAHKAERQAFYDAALLAAIPSTLTGTWTRGDKPMSNIPDRMSIAAEIALYALQHRQINP